MLYFRLNSSECADVASAYEARPDVFACIESFAKCNSVSLSRGRQSGEAHLLITKTMKNALVLNGANTIQLVHDTGTVSMPWWFVYSCEAVTHGDGSETNQLYHVHLKDCRFVGELKTIQETPSAIRDTHRMMSGTQPSPVTWQTVLDSLWAELPTLAKGASTTCPTLPSVTSNAENLTFEGVTAWRAISQALAAAGCVATFNPVSGVYTFIKADDSHTSLSTEESTAASNILWDGSISDIACAAPENVGIVFPPQSTDSQKIIWYGSVNTNSVSSGISGLSGTRIDIVDTTRVEKDSSGTITNSTQMTNRIDDLKHTIIGASRAASSRKIRRYVGYRSFTIGGKLTHIEYAATKSFAGTTIRYQGAIEFDLPSAYPAIPVRWVTRSAARIRATYTSGSNATVVDGIDGPLPSPLTVGGTVAFTNPVGHELCTGMVLKLEQHYQTGAWEIYDIPVKKCLTNVYLDGINLKKTDSCGTTTTIYEGTTCS